MSDQAVPLFSTGIPNLDELLGGGLPANTLNIIAGEPGTGKTILAQQALFHYVRRNPGARVLYLTTLSEPAMKVIRYLQGFTFYDPEAFGTGVVYRDVGSFLREHPPAALLEEVVRLVEDVQPAVLCVDSFKAIRDLMPSQEEFRRFCYDLSVRLASAASPRSFLASTRTSTPRRAPSSRSRTASSSSSAASSTASPSASSR
jgi:circadian clock protein KaiC